ncbi:hypothetical protein A3Q56_08784, partial [Intoshia linei]
MTRHTEHLPFYQEKLDMVGIHGFTNAHKIYGIHAYEDGTIEAIEWCPGIKNMYLFGEF